MKFIETTCALCGTKGNSDEVFADNLDELSSTTQVFSARRLPDRRFYRWVRCRSCHLYRSDPVLDIDLAKLYKESTFDYGSEIIGLKETYAKIVKRSLKPDIPKGHILEIGGGNGFFLEKALEIGFESISGVEPSKPAVDSAIPHIRQHMKVAMFDNECAEDDSIDVIAIFHTLDHLRDPVKFLSIALRKLSQGGKIVIAVHNVNALSSILLRSKSPIFDVEHTYLFSKKTLKNCLTEAGFNDVKVGRYANLYSIAYLIHLLPISSRLKILILQSKFGLSLRKVKLWAPLGNIWASGSKKYNTFNRSAHGLY
jgi:SAM-dependent methyltransferase